MCARVILFGSCRAARTRLVAPPKTVGAKCARAVAGLSIWANPAASDKIDAAVRSMLRREPFPAEPFYGPLRKSKA